jgi:hypothetical protein
MFTNQIIKGLKLFVNINSIILSQSTCILPFLYALCRIVAPVDLVRIPTPCNLYPDNGRLADWRLKIPSAQK